MNRGKIYSKSHGPKYEKILEWVGSGNRVLDIGCGTGDFGKRMIENNNYVAGVDNSEVHFKEAKENLDKFFSADIETTKFKKSFDKVIMADVLEHLPDPKGTLSYVKTITKREIIISVPNIAFIQIRLNLLLGKFNYTEKGGILDDTHLRFFTKNTIENLLGELDLKIIDFASPAPIWLQPLASLFPSLFGYQLLYRCKV